MKVTPAYFDLYTQLSTGVHAKVIFVGEEVALSKVKVKCAFQKKIAFAAGNHVGLKKMYYNI
jgi:hypothetical protein